MIYSFSFLLSLISTLTLIYKINIKWYFTIIVYIFFVAIYIALALFIAYIFSLFVNQKKPIEKPSKFYNLIFLVVNQFLCNSARIKVEIKNKALLDKNKKYLIVCNHRSRFDSMIIANTFKNIQMSFASKPSNFKIPLVGNVIHKCGYVSIDRENDKNALRSILHASKLLKENNICYGIFPEGTRNKSAYGLLDFKNGCFKIAQKANCSICVMTLKNTEKIKKNFPFKSTRVILDVVDIIEPTIFESNSTIEIGNKIKYQMLQSLNELE